MIANRHGGSGSSDPFAAAPAAAAATTNSSDPAPAVASPPAVESTSNSFTLLVDASAFGKPGKDKYTLTATTSEELKGALGASLGLFVDSDFVVQAYDSDFDEFVNLNLLSQLADGKGKVRVIKRVAVQATPAPEASVVVDESFADFTNGTSTQGAGGGDDDDEQEEVDLTASPSAPAAEKGTTAENSVKHDAKKPSSGAGGEGDEKEEKVSHTIPKLI